MAKRPFRLGECGGDPLGVPLPGGHRDRPVRVDDTVRRPLRPWSESVQSLLAHLHAHGCHKVPFPLGFDENRREILSYISGVAASGSPLPAYVWYETTLASVGRTLRTMHDATASFIPPSQSIWNPRHACPTRGDVMCHNDLGPWNAVFHKGRLRAFVDWDAAAPGTRYWDLAGAAWHWVPFWPDERSADHGFAKPSSRLARLQILCDAYGIPAEDRALVVKTVMHRQEAWVDALQREARDGDAASAGMIAAGAVIGTRADRAVAAQALKALIGA